jgi:hypothetical protein
MISAFSLEILLQSETSIPIHSALRKKETDFLSGRVISQRLLKVKWRSIDIKCMGFD